MSFPFSSVWGFGFICGSANGVAGTAGKFVSFVTQPMVKRMR
jgi:hypothetical protein